MTRIDLREFNEIREPIISLDYLNNSDGSVLISSGNNKIICCATIADGVPSFLRNSSNGWLTAEYSMLPCSANNRIQREAIRGKQSGRTQEIQRLIGRSLRSAVKLNNLTGFTIQLDADVIQADGGTRVLSITGCYVALVLALANKFSSENLAKYLKYQVAGISLGILNDKTLVDLKYEEDSSCDADVNIIMNHKHELIEIQGTAEGSTFNLSQLNSILSLAQDALDRLFLSQRNALSEKQIILNF